VEDAPVKASSVNEQRARLLRAAVGPASWWFNRPGEEAKPALPVEPTSEQRPAVLDKDGNPYVEAD
jgi:hypothetical protein